MKTQKNLHVFYDKEGDTLELRLEEVTEAYLKSFGNAAFERIDEKTGEVKGFTILNFRELCKIRFLENFKA